jgi:hypothetical protein
MPDRLPTTEAEHHARRRGGPPARASEAEVFALVHRAAGVADGLALLRQAPLECAAVLLGVEPRILERVRAALEDAALAGEAALRFARAAAGPRAGAAVVAAPAPAPRDPEALLAAARRRAGGLALLLDTAPECAAIVFGVPPDLVLRAREAAARAGPGRGAPPAS